MRSGVRTGIPVRNITTGEPCDLHVANIHIESGQLLCECSEGLYYCKKEDGLTCPDCGTQYERIDMAKTSKKKASTKKIGEKLPRAIAKSDLLTGEKVDLKKPRAEKPKKEVRSFRVTRHLKVELSASEVDQRGRDAARFRRDIKSDEVELKSITSTFKARIATAEGQLDTALQEVDGRCTYRDVDCEEIWDHGELVVRLVRLDTGAEFERRNMTRDELQMNLPLPDKKAPKADGTEKMACHGKVAPETTKKLKESAVERLNDDGDLTASELRARKRKQEALLDAFEEKENTCGVPVKDSPSAEGDEDGEFEDEDDEPEDDDAVDDPW